MSTAPKSRAQLEQELSAAFQVMTGQSTLLSERVAQQLGLSSSDLEALGVVYAGQAVSPGGLAAATGLTSGAVTALIDRLAARGFVTREPHPNDRRKVVIRMNASKAAEVEALYVPLGRSMSALFAEYTEDELRLVASFLNRRAEIALSEAENLGKRSSSADRGIG